jgi:uncharacterized membrane protein
VTASAPEVGERSRDLERILTFVDAIAAVAITLLVLPLVDLGNEIRSADESVWHLVTTHANQFWAFALSFAVIARLWLAQHVLFRSVIASTRGMVTLLMLWSMAIVFLPFPTALLPVGGEQAATKVLYLGTLTLSAICLAGIAIIIGRDRRLRDTDKAPTPTTSLATAVAFLLALAISLAVPVTSYYPLLLLVVTDPAVALIARLRNRRS